MRKVIKYKDFISAEELSDWVDDKNAHFPRVEVINIETCSVFRLWYYESK